MIIINKYHVAVGRAQAFLSGPQHILVSYLFIRQESRSVFPRIRSITITGENTVSYHHFYWLLIESFTLTQYNWDDRHDSKTEYWELLEVLIRIWSVQQTAYCIRS
jgi:hypothetical protein